MRFANFVSVWLYGFGKSYVHAGKFNLSGRHVKVYEYRAITRIVGEQSANNFSHFISIGKINIRMKLDVYIISTENKVQICIVERYCLAACG